MREVLIQKKKKVTILAKFGMHSHKSSPPVTCSEVKDDDPNELYFFSHMVVFLFLVCDHATVDMNQMIYLKLLH